MHSTTRKTALPAAALAAALGLAACGGGSDSAGSGSGTSSMSGMGGSSTAAGSPTASATGTPATGANNQADVTFASSMIPHHRQAVSMAELAATRASSADVKALAEQIKAAQGPEIVRMSGWLSGWGVPVPTTAGMGSMDMGGASMGGMMSDQQMSDLAAQNGAAFDKAFLTAMVAHHRGAVAMAKTELSQGQNAEAKQLAQSVVDNQSKEIDEMTALLAGLGS